MKSVWKASQGLLSKVFPRSRSTAYQLRSDRRAMCWCAEAAGWYVVWMEPAGSMILVVPCLGWRRASTGFEVAVESVGTFGLDSPVANGQSAAWLQVG